MVAAEPSVRAERAGQSYVVRAVKHGIQGPHGWREEKQHIGREAIDENAINVRCSC